MKSPIPLLASFLTGTFILFFSAAEAQESKSSITLQNTFPRKRVAVLDLKTRDGVSESIAALLSDNLRSTLFEFDAFDLLNREDMDSIFKEIKFPASGACDTSCVVEAGTALGVEKMVSGSIGKVGNLFALSLRMMDIEKAHNEVVLSEQYSGTDTGLPGFVDAAGEKLADQAMKTWAKDEGWVYTPPKRDKGLRRQDIYREKMHKPVVAGVLGVIPGAGQAYNKQKLKAISLAVLWVGAITATVLTDAKMQDAKAAYQDANYGADFDGLIEDHVGWRRKNKVAFTVVLSLPLVSVVDAFLFGKKRARSDQ